MLPPATVGLISLALLVTACTGAFRSSPTHDDSAKTIEQIFSQHYSTQVHPNERMIFTPTGASLLHGYSRDMHNELSLHFPRLPNPTIIMYIFPHLSFEGTPVPGYTTTFPMYETTHYALPGEIVVK